MSMRDDQMDQLIEDVARSLTKHLPSTTLRHGIASRIALSNRARLRPVLVWSISIAVVVMGIGFSVWPQRLLHITRTPRGQQTTVPARPMDNVSVVAPRIAAATTPVQMPSIALREVSRVMPRTNASSVPLLIEPLERVELVIESLPFPTPLTVDAALVIEPIALTAISVQSLSQQ
jgi:hypothetical protein